MKSLPVYTAQKKKEEKHQLNQSLNQKTNECLHTIKHEMLKLKLASNGSKASRIVLEIRSFCGGYSTGLSNQSKNQVKRTNTNSINNFATPKSNNLRTT